MSEKHVGLDRLSRRGIMFGVTVSFLTPVEHLLAATEARSAAIDWPTLRMLDGSTRSPSSWAGKPAVLVFWETWCPYCKRHNANVEKLYRVVDSKNLFVLGVSLEADYSKISNYMQANQFHFPVALADNSFRAKFSERRVIPLTCLISAQGALFQAIPGEMSEDDVLSLAAVHWA